MSTSEREQLVANMDRLTAGVETIAGQYREHIDYREEDPETFGAGHFVLYDSAGDTSRWVIEEQYADTDWSDPDRVPTSWTWEDQRRRRLPDGGHGWVVLVDGEIASADVESLIEKTQTWAHTVRNTHLRQAFFSLSSPPASSHERPPPHRGL